jgi:6-phosphogluconolactonase
MLSAQLIQECVEAVLESHGKCGVLLTGGRSAERLYMAWARLHGFQRLTGVNFYFGDERCVLPNHPDSNFGLVLRVLFSRGVPRGCRISRMEADDPDRESAAMRYGELLPEKIDVMLSGVGNDGHIASLFPGSDALREVRRKVLPVIGPMAPRERLTITPQVIAAAGAVFVLAPGKTKSDVFDRMQKSGYDCNLLPACLPRDAVWLLDDQAADDHDGRGAGDSSLAWKSNDEST